jgi:hypothetical protein
MTKTLRRFSIAVGAGLVLVTLVACKPPTEQHGPSTPAASVDTGAALADAKAAKDAEAVAAADAAAPADQPPATPPPAAAPAPAAPAAK